MAITRRQFLCRSGAVAAGTMFGRALFGNPLVRYAYADTIGDRYFVILYLDGGNDGLNTVVPLDNGGGSLRSDYDVARSSLNLTPAQLAATAIGNDPNTGAQLALHPGLAGTGVGLGGLKALYDEGKVAVVQGCGYPNYRLSHDEAQVVWRTANPLGLSGYAGAGWMGRFLADASQMYGGSDVPAVNVAGAIAGEYQQNQTSVLAIRRLRDFGFPYDPFTMPDTPFKRAAFEALYQSAAATTEATFTYLGDTGDATLLSSESYLALNSLYETDRASYSTLYQAVDSSVARDLREIAKVIYGVTTSQPNVNARLFQLHNGGYDTHSDQGGAVGLHHDLLKEVGDSLRVFFQDLADMPGDVAAKTTVLVWSEFGRRIHQNDGGTDHGSQAPMFVIGGSVNGGVYGNHPNIAVAAQDDEGNTVYSQAAADPFRSTDIRDVYGTILKHWLNMPPAAVTSILPGDAGSPSSYWTSPNFDLGFLP